MVFEDALPDLRRAMQGLRFGSVELVIYEGHVVQIEGLKRPHPAGGFGDLAQPEDLERRPVELPRGVGVCPASGGWE